MSHYPIDCWKVFKTFPVYLWSLPPNITVIIFRIYAALYTEDIIIFSPYFTKSYSKVLLNYTLKWSGKHPVTYHAHLPVFPPTFMSNTFKTTSEYLPVGNPEETVKNTLKIWGIHQRNSSILCVNTARYHVEEYLEETWKTLRNLFRSFTTKYARTILDIFRVLLGARPEDFPESILKLMLKIHRNYQRHLSSLPPFYM